MIIYFRVCEKQETISYVDRFNYANKTELLKKCWISLQSGITNSDKVIVIHDSVSSDTLEFIADTCKTNNLEFIKVPEHSWEYHLHTVVLIEVLSKYCALFPEEIHYIVEDDYMHYPYAISIMNDNLKEWAGFAVSYDYPDRYANAQPAMVVLGTTRHWRTITSSTMTVLAKGKTWLSYIGILKKAAPTSNDKIFEEIYTKTACISPIPALSSHMTKYHLSPFIDWEGMYNDIDIEDY